MGESRTDRSVWVETALGIGGIIVHYVSFHPLDLGFLGWVCLVPWIILGIRGQSSRSGWILYGSILVLSLAQLRWMTVADYRMIGTWLLLGWWCSLFHWVGLKLAGVGSRKTPIPLAILVPVIWVSLEYAKAFLLTGFPWYYLAHTQHSGLALIQSADLAGTQALSFAVGMANGLVAEGILWWFFHAPGDNRSPRPLMISTIIFSILITGMWIYGMWRLETVRLDDGPAVALLQGNHAQAVRNNDDHFRQTWLDYRNMLEKAKGRNVDLIVWPETSFPFELPVAPGEEGPLLGRNDEQDIWSGPPQLLGVNVAVVKGKDVVCRHNSSMLQDFQNRKVTRYDKIHRVPFGEYIPFKDLIPAMNWLSPYDFDYSIRAGTRSTRFQLPWSGRVVSFSALLCYEDSDFHLTRWSMNSSPPPDFWVNQSNDGWFQGTEEQAQHLATARFRCVETRRTMVRAVNAGISAFIDPLGRVLAPRRVENDIYDAIPPTDNREGWKWGDFKDMSMVLVGEIPLCRLSTPYVMVGDWLAWICVCLTLGSSLFIFVRRNSG